MEINEDKASGLKIETNDYEVIIAKAKDTKSNIIGEVWFQKK
jgi:hypothetical protein